MRTVSETKDGLASGVGPSIGAAILRTCASNVMHGMKRFIQSRASRSPRRRLVLSESLALGNRRQIHLVTCDGLPYLIGAGADSVGSIVALQHGALEAATAEAALAARAMQRSADPGIASAQASKQAQQRLNLYRWPEGTTTRESQVRHTVSAQPVTGFVPGLDAAGTDAGTNPGAGSSVWH